MHTWRSRSGLAAAEVLLRLSITVLDYLSCCKAKGDIIL